MARSVTLTVDDDPAVSQAVTRDLRSRDAARMVLLTACADTDAAITAINDVGLDHYLMKPWAPPEDRLFPVLDDLLDAWQQMHAPRFAAGDVRHGSMKRVASAVGEGATAVHLVHRHLESV